MSAWAELHVHLEGTLEPELAASWDDVAAGTSGGGRLTP